MFFKCKHPSSRLVVYKDSTVKNKDEDFDIITHHLSCRKCGERIDIKYAKVIGGVKAFFGRGEANP